MIDLGISKLALIGAVALVVIGPEKLPRVARMVGTMLGKAQRYVNDVKAEVNRSMELDELKKMKDSVTSAAHEVESSLRDVGSEFERNMLFDILNERYEKRRPTLLLSNLNIDEVKAYLGERVFDRLREDGGEVVVFDWQSWRSRPSSACGA